MSNNVIGFAGNMYATGNISANTYLSINNIPVMNNTSLYSGIVNSQLTSLGTILNFNSTNATTNNLYTTSASISSLYSNSSTVGNLNITSGVLFSNNTSPLTNYNQTTWTPVWTNMTGTITNGTSNYTKIGNIVSFNYNTGTNSTLITGTGGTVYFNLPYTAANGGNFLACNTNNSNIQYSSGIGLINKNVAYPPTFVINQTSGILYSGTYLSNS